MQFFLKVVILSSIALVSSSYKMTHLISYDDSTIKIALANSE